MHRQLDHVFVRILAESIVVDGTVLLHIMLVAQLFLSKHFLEEVSHLQKVGQLFGFWIFNYPSLDAVLSRKHEVRDFSLGHFEMQTVLGIVFIVKSKNFFDVFFFHKSEVADDIDPIFFGELVFLGVLLSCHSSWQTAIPDVEEFVHIHDSQPISATHNWRWNFVSRMIKANLNIVGPSLSEGFSNHDLS